jgi:RNA polymerase sigma-70 factor (ECF subfamily)
MLLPKLHTPECDVNKVTHLDTRPDRNSEQAVGSSDLTTAAGHLGTATDQQSAGECPIAESGVMPPGELLFDITLAALRRRSRQMLRTFPSVRRWDETDDICQTVAMQLWQTFQQQPPTSMRQFYAFASQRIRWCLLSLARKYRRPGSLEARHETWGDMDSPPREQQATSSLQDGPVSLAHWTEFHRKVESLPGLTGEVFNMIWYLGLPASTVARTLNISEATVRRHWRRARIQLAEWFDDTLMP